MIITLHPERAINKEENIILEHREAYTIGIGKKLDMTAGYSPFSDTFMTVDSY
ncbi:MAG: hypothetical protein WBW71_00555 [Bacteroidota bacterium]